VGATEGSLPPVARREAVRRNVQIFRIRQRLRTASLTAAVAGWWLRPRFRWVTPGAATALLPAALLVPVLVLPLLPPGHGAGSGSEPADASVVTRLLESRDVPLQLACGRCAAPAAPRRPTARPSAPNTESVRQRQSTVVTQTPVGPVGVAAESTARRGRELVCVGGITPGWRETCLDDPTSMPSAARL
jgi:hypothetical protein